MNNLKTLTTTNTSLQCYHCGDDCPDDHYQNEEKKFCCLGCQSVFQILSANQLCSYYTYNDTPGQTQKDTSRHYEYLDEPKIIGQLVDYSDDKISIITFYIPAIHCSSCLWLLEHLYSVCKKRYKQLIVNNLTCFIALKGI